MMMMMDSDRYLSLLQARNMNVLVFPIVTVLVMCILYGFYITLFVLCVRVLRQGELRRQPLCIASLVILFVVSTTMVAVETTKLIQTSVVELTFIITRDTFPIYNFLTHDTLKTTIYVFNLTLPVLANLCADFILVHRCFIIWGFRKRILGPLIFVSLVTNVTSCTGAIMFLIGYGDRRVTSNTILLEKGGTIQAVGLITSAAFNLALTFLTAGRIWWIARGVAISRNYVATNLIKIILQSGILYPLMTTVHLSIVNTSHRYNVPLDTLPLVVLTAGIAPTLVIVRIRLRMNASDDEIETQPRFSSQVQLSSIQPTGGSLFFSRLSTSGYRNSLIEGDSLKPLPKALLAVHAV
ncbi:hypothetical protein E1B28_007120 [Marasmius oreades]|uniref:Uncharacterized protein n=1 Tax=Marasmius oreades TaxID=181124 RepID=A0A9P7S1L6_9AGAR|nr:uncharacterized protein E1B28_007120 [Marasmius oreades]KAG7093442.1 hypothetical protein E1B28_007120 [Marasmius oreades]